MPEGALTSLAVGYVSDAYHYFAGHAMLMTSQSRLRIEYLLLTDNIVALD